MSGQYFNTITENASRLGMRLHETFSERTRDLAITRGSSSVYLDTPEDKVKNLGRQLDSSSDREKLDAMKRLVALISKGRNVSEYFAQVVKNVASQNLEIRKLVYIYLLRYAEQEPDLALLSINTFQRDLADSSPLIRAMALRVLSGIKVPMIGSIVVLAIKKCAADVSPYVRKAAALAIPKCYNLDTTHLPALVMIISTLLRDRSPLSVGSVAVAFEAVCPTRLDLLHQQYRRLCKILVDVDEWGQVVLLNLMARYARTMLSRPTVTMDGDAWTEEVDSDLSLLLTCSEPLFQSRNPAVVLAVARAFYYIGPPSQVPKILHPLLRLLHISKEVERVVLTYMLVISQTVPHLLSPIYSRFLVRADDITQVKKDKIHLLLNIINIENYQAILRELIDYTGDVDDLVVSESIHAIGRCARAMSDSTQQCLTALMSMIKSRHDIVVSNAVLVLKYLVQTQPELSTISSAQPSQSPLTIISHLARRIDDIRHAQAKACVCWLVGQYSASSQKSTSGLDGIVEWAPDVLRKSAKSFCQEAPVVKLQIITLAAKLFVLCPTDQNMGLLSRYVLSLARYDLNYDVRDRGRMLSSLLAGLNPTPNGEDVNDERGGVVLRREQVRLVLFNGKAATIEDNKLSNDDHAVLGSLRAITRKHMQSDSFLPDWLEEGTESLLRDSEDDAHPNHNVTGAALMQPSKGPSGLEPAATLGASPLGSGDPNTRSKDPWIDLDKFYQEDDDDDEQSEDESVVDDHGQHSTDDDSTDDDSTDEEEDGDNDGDENKLNSDTARA